LNLESRINTLSINRHNERHISIRYELKIAIEFVNPDFLDIIYTLPAVVQFDQPNDLFKYRKH
jgi:hypothetical protein